MDLPEDGESFISSYPEGEPGLQAQTHDGPLARGYRMYGVLQFSVGGQHGFTASCPLTLL